MDRKQLKKEYARLIAESIKDNIEPKDIERIENAKKEIRNKLLKYDLNKKIYKIWTINSKSIYKCIDNTKKEKRNKLS